MKLYTQEEAAGILGYRNYRSLNKLVALGYLECIKRPGRNGRKLFLEQHITQYIKRCQPDIN